MLDAFDSIHWYQNINRMVFDKQKYKAKEAEDIDLAEKYQKQLLQYNPLSFIRYRCAKTATKELEKMGMRMWRTKKLHYNKHATQDDVFKDMKYNTIGETMFDFFHAIDNRTGVSNGGIIDYLVIEQKQVTNVIGRVIGEKQIY